MLSVVIPTRNPGPLIEPLLADLHSQQRLADEILVVDTASSDGTADRAEAAGCRVERITVEQFGHGRTRNQAVRWAKGDLIVFLSQDVQPANDAMLGELVAPLERGEAAAAYARQLPTPTARPSEAALRSFLYPDEPDLRRINGDARAGRRFMFSNAASVVAREPFEAVGGFPEDAIICEDMLLSARLQHAGYAVRYTPEAQVLHSHAYSSLSHFRRYFDMGTVQRDFADDLVGRTPQSAQGVALVRAQARAAWQKRDLGDLARLLPDTAMRWLGLQLGRRHDRLPEGLCRWASMHRL